MVVGNSAVGKTSLVRSLQDKEVGPRLLSTDGIDMGNISIGEKNIHHLGFWRTTNLSIHSSIILNRYSIVFGGVSNHR